MIRFTPALALALVAVSLPGLALFAGIASGLTFALATERAIEARYP
jgi:hypothetical protein